MTSSASAVEIGCARVHEVDLPREAFARANSARHPVGLDLVPERIGKAFEDEIGRIFERNRTVEVDRTLETIRLSLVPGT